MNASFDVVAAREERDRFDALWVTGNRSDERTAYNNAIALLDRALDALASGWTFTEAFVERAAKAAFRADNGGDGVDYHAIARAVLASAGRTPAAITDAMVEEAAIRAWCAPTSGGSVGAEGEWSGMSAFSKGSRINEARAVLEYAASLGVVTAAPPVSRPFKLYGALPQLPILATCERDGLTEAETVRALAEHVEGLATELRRGVEESHAAPVDTGDLIERAVRAVLAASPVGQCVADRLVMYRCAASEMMGDVNGWSPEEKARGVEDIAHAMLAAERSPT